MPKKRKKLSRKSKQSKPHSVHDPAVLEAPAGIEIETSSGSHRRLARSHIRKHLDERLRSLYQRAMAIEKELQELDDDRFYRVCIFGSARIKPESEEYNEVFTLARFLSWQSIDILTGGGPGLMEAANKGAQLGQEEKKTKSLSLGITIQLDFEPIPNSHIDVKRHHHKFSSRLDDFMRLSHAVIVTPGGIGTLLELYFSWQLIQVKHMTHRPIVLMDKSYWSGLIEWMKDFPLARSLMSAKDFDPIYIVDSPEEVVDIISKDHKNFIKRREDNIKLGSK